MKVHFKDYLKQIRILHLAMMAGDVMFALVILFLSFGGNNSGGNNHPLGLYLNTNDVFFYLISAFVLFGLIASNFIYNKQIQKVKKTSSLAKKLDDFRKAHIVHLALLQGPTLFGLVFCWIFNNLFFLCLAVITWLAMMFILPNKEKIIGDLDLNWEERAQLKNPNALVAHSSRRN